MQMLQAASALRLTSSVDPPVGSLGRFGCTLASASACNAAVMGGHFLSMFMLIGSAAGGIERIGQELPTASRGAITSGGTSLNFDVATFASAPFPSKPPPATQAFVTRSHGIVTHSCAIVTRE